MWPSASLGSASDGALREVLRVLQTCRQGSSRIISAARSARGGQRETGGVVFGHAGFFRLGIFSVFVELQGRSAAPRTARKTTSN